MRIRVLVQNEAGSRQKNSHNEKTLVWLYSEAVSHPYPFPYGFITGTSAPDGDSVDCFIITTRDLRSNQMVECEPIGLMEQFEDEAVAHNVLARLPGDTVDLTDTVKAALVAHVRECFAHVEGKRMSVGPFLDAAAARAHILTHTAWSTTHVLRWFMRGAVAGVLGSLPLAALCALLFRFPIPFVGYRSGVIAMVPAMFAALFYGVMGGIPVQAVLGGAGGAIGAWASRPDESRMRRCAFVVSMLFAVPGIVTLAVLDYLVGRW